MDFHKKSDAKRFRLVLQHFFNGGLFLYFVIGFLTFQKYISLEHVYVRMVPYIVFFALVPYWNYSAANHVASDAPTLISDSSWLLENYTFIVALAGTLTFVDISRLMHDYAFGYFNDCMCSIGSASLSIYAIHWYFIGLTPPVITPVIMCMASYFIIGYIPVARRLLLGK